VAAVQQRIGVIFAVFFLALVLAGARTLYLGTVRAPALRKAAQTQQLSTENLPAQRGTITDRNGVNLAVSEPAQEISADPYLVKEPLKAARELAPLLGETQARVLSKLSERRGFVDLAHALPARQARAVTALKLEGITGTPTTRRVYPRHDLAAQVLGLVGTEGTGLSGLEYSQNALLQGVAGERKVISDAIGQPISIENVHAEKPGKTLTLTLDANIQQRAEDVLNAVGRDFAPKDATAIVMDPRTGALLALANWPQINADDPRAATPQALEEAMEDRAVAFNYEPGSTFKVVAVSGGLEAGLITPDTPFNIPYEIQVADRKIHDAEEHPDETLTVSEILAQSSNVGEIQIGERDGAERFNEWVHKYGFGARTGVELPGEEAGATLPLNEYSGSSMGNLPIGQGELVTPMQMAAAYAAIANGGVLRRPHIIGAIDGRPRSEPAGRRVISETTAAEIRTMLKGVLAPGGTASELSIPGYELAGKTGTASKIDPATGEYSESAYVASFIGFAPAKDPKLLCAVVVDEPQNGSIYGGTVAAPAFGQIMSFALPYLRIPPG
jgi:cell division protein FtsI (penicillin-binding protein 3)